MPDVTRIPAAPPTPLSFASQIRMRDGVQLAGDVYLPGAPHEADTTPGDTILIRLPYDKLGTYCFIPSIAEYFAQHNYRVVAQDVRGKFRSAGDALLFVNEADDGYDTIEWITHQPWSNGRVAMWGDSYFGYTQWAAAATGHPALKAISPRVTGTQLGEPVRSDPQARSRAVESGITYMYALTHFMDQDMVLWEPDWSRHNLAAQAEDFMAQEGHRSISYDQWYPHAVTLPRFPADDPFVGRSVPTLHTIGWWDNCAPLSWADVESIEDHPNWDRHHYLRVEAIDHESFELLEAHEGRGMERTAQQIQELLPRTLDPTIEFFEIFVRGNGSAAAIPRVTWRLSHTDEMRTCSAWPPAGVRTVTRFATESGGLAASKPATAGELTWTHDPDDLVPSSVADPFAYLMHWPDEAPIGARADVLRFETGSAGTDVDLAGPVTAHVHVASDGPIMDCFVRVLDVAPDGTALRIARGQRQLLEASEGGALTIDLGHLGYRLRAGHRLRVHVSSSDYPEFLSQTGTGADPWAWGETCRNAQTIVIGGPEAFALDFTVLEGELP